jgi:hypothetical protein
LREGETRARSSGPKVEASVKIEKAVGRRLKEVLAR